MSKWKIAKWSIGALFAMSAVAMGVAAATADSDVGVRSDGSRVPPGSDDQDVRGDPKGGAPPFHEESATPDTEGGRSSDPQNRPTDPAARS